jgi:hypothetical protein
MLDLIREVSEGTHGDRFLRRVLRITIALSLVRNNHLTVSLGSEGTRLKKRLSVPDTSGVDVKSCMDVIDGVDNEVELLPEVIMEDSFSIRTNSSLIVPDIESGVHSLGNLASSCRF